MNIYWVSWTSAVAERSDMPDAGASFVTCRALADAEQMVYVMLAQRCPSPYTNEVSKVTKLYTVAVEFISEA